MAVLAMILWEDSSAAPARTAVAITLPALILTP
ncbi:Uncharacterised protein [Vibrio cholerae]|nr:Uncharacterised protein [Vibrio cholerae]